MGMSASQARYLQLTARKSDLEYRAQQLAQGRLALAASTEQIEKEYAAKLNNRRLYYNTNGNRGPLNYYDIVNGIEDGGMDMQLVDAFGNIVAPAIPATLENGKKVSDYVVDEGIKKSEYLDECLRNSVYFLAKREFSDETGEEVLSAINYENCTFINDVFYDEDDSDATIKYEQEMSKVQRQDKTFELDLKEVDSERTALETEMQSIKKIIEEDAAIFKSTFGG